ncbi:MAG TPA: hypothetical protein VFC78_05220 [Tepidisphaeraceae bacterium]|nr:hypothetical protein [Tepidisphaeraceae bacterium]
MLASQFLELSYQAAALAGAQVPGSGSEIQSTQVDFSNTIEVTNLSLYDTSGNLIVSRVVTSALGAQYPGTAPEPNGILALAAILFGLLVRPRAASVATFIHGSSK